MFFTRSSHPATLAALIVLLAGPISELPAAIRTWNNTAPAGSSWYTASNWTNPFVPTSEDQVRIQNSGIALINSAGAVAGWTRVGRGSGNGSLLVGTGGDFTHHDTLDIGYEGTGIGLLTISGGGIVQDALQGDEDYFYGYDINVGSGATGTINLTGEGSELINRSIIYLGSWSYNGPYSGSGYLNTSDDATLTARDIFIGSGAYYESGQWYTGNGEATISSGATWDLSGQLYVGFQGGVGSLTHTEGTLTMAESGYSVTVGFSMGSSGENVQRSQGTVLVDGASSTWSLEAALQIGVAGSIGEMTVSGGALVEMTSTLQVGTGSAGSGSTEHGGTGVLNLDGAGTRMTAGLYTYIGITGGSGTVNITDGALLEGGYTYIGYGSGSTLQSVGNVLVSGEGSRWEQIGLIMASGYEAAGGVATLTVEDGGYVLSSNGVDMAGVTGAYSATINLNGTVDNRGVLEALSIWRNAGGTAKISFDGGVLRARSNSTLLQNFALGEVELKADGGFIDTQNFNVLLNVPLSGSGGLTKQGTGTLTMSSTNTYLGETVVESGTLIVTGNISSSSLTQVDAGATLTGNGTVGAVNLEGKIAPGMSPGVMVTGEEAWSGDGSYEWEIVNFDGTSGTDWDRLDIDGALILGNTVENPFTIFIRSMSTSSVYGNALNFNEEEQYSFVLATTTDGIVDFDAAAFLVDATGFTNPAIGQWSVSQDGDNLLLNYAPVPEPGVVVLGILAGAALLTGRRHRRGT